MPINLDVSFAALDAEAEATTVVLTGEAGALGDVATRLDKRADGAIRAAARVAEFKGKAKAAIELLAPKGIDIDRLIVFGTGAADDEGGQDWVSLGGAVLAQVAGRKSKVASVAVDIDPRAGCRAGQIAADLALGALLRSYSFKKYLTRGEGNGNGNGNGPDKLVILTADPAGARAAYVHAKAVAEGVGLARDLVNEPANALGPEEFAERTKALAKLGVEVEILETAELEKLKMGALLGVAQGSVRPARVVVMQWHGPKVAKKSKPLCFVGKGVTFDTGGISMKPAAGMEDMKGDMGGAACVTGLMHALAARKAPVNAVGLIGLVENMPSGSAQRPGDIVTSMSGQTIEVLNTDAEGRLVLADVLWYAQERFKPKLVIDLATLTGAIMVALGKEYAGLFANDDKLAADLAAAGEATGDKVWRMPLAKAYDKLIDSKNADMKNIGGRFGGAITAAQFLARYIHKGTAWAHLDVAGVAMDSNKTDTSQGWASGWGVRLLDRLVSDGHEKA